MWNRLWKVGLGDKVATDLACESGWAGGRADDEGDEVGELHFWIGLGTLVWEIGRSGWVWDKRGVS